MRRTAFAALGLARGRRIEALSAAMTTESPEGRLMRSKAITRAATKTETAEFRLRLIAAGLLLLPALLLLLIGP